MKTRQFIALTILFALVGTVASTPVVRAEEIPPLSVQGSVPAQVEFWTPTQVPIHAMVLSMVERDLEYDVSDPYFVWSSLYYMISFYGQGDFRVEMADEYFSIPYEMAMDYAVALFADMTELPEIPSTLTGFVSYRGDKDSYEFGLGDKALVETKTLSVQGIDQNSYQIQGVLVAQETQTQLAMYQGVLSRQDNMFGFSFEDFSLVMA